MTFDDLLPLLFFFFNRRKIEIILATLINSLYLSQSAADGVIPEIKDKFLRQK